MSGKTVADARRSADEQDAPHRNVHPATSPTHLRRLRPSTKATDALDEADVVVRPGPSSMGSGELDPVVQAIQRTPTTASGRPRV